MTDDQHGDQHDAPRPLDRPHTGRLVSALVSAPTFALAIGAAFGAFTALVNNLSNSQADLESSAYTTSGWSYPEILSLLLDSGWAWAGSAVAVGWLLTRAVKSRPAALARGAVAGVLTLLAATGAYGVVETVSAGLPLSSWYLSESPLWWVASVVLGAPLGAVGTCCARPGVIGFLARLSVPVGAAAQAIVMPPGRNEVVATIGQAVVGLMTVLGIGFILVHFRRTERHRPAPAGAELP